MVASMKPPRDLDIEQQSHTERLANWINTVRCKKLMCRRNRKRDLRVEAVLTAALFKAELELRNKQISRITRWQQLKKQFLQEMDYNYNSYNHHDHHDDRSKMNEKDLWQDSLHAELTSLDNFMLQLGEIKSPLQR